MIETVDAGCYWTAPILISKADVLTEQTAEQVLAHNLTWAQRCGAGKHQGQTQQ